MHQTLEEINSKIYNKLNFEISNHKIDLESKEYAACSFKLSGRNILYRNAKITPKKVGQFVTFWKRKENGPIEPFEESDLIDFYIVSVRTEKRLGQFVFPKTVLIKKGIISTEKKEGKRAFRVYPIWDAAKNNQAIKTQKWQLDYFYEINEATKPLKVVDLFQLS